MIFFTEMNGISFLCCIFILNNNKQQLSILDFFTCCFVVIKKKRLAMIIHADKTSENKSQAVANSLLKRQTNSASTFQFVDNRPTAIAQRKRQEMMNNHFAASKSVAQLKTLQRVKFTTHVPIAPDAGAPYSLGFHEGGGAVTGNALDEKMVLLHRLSAVIQASNAAFAPHVALSFHAGAVRVAVNRGTSGSAATLDQLRVATNAAMQGAADYVATLSPKTQAWFAKYYKAGHPVIHSLSHATPGIGMALPEHGTIHAEQFISKHVALTEATAAAAAEAPLDPGQYRGEAGIKAAPAGSRKVVRIGGMLDDCALCHIDHHGAPFQAGEPTAHNPRLARTAHGAMIFTGEAESSDATLRQHGKGIMTTGTHWRAAHGVATQAPNTHPAFHIAGQGITVPTAVIHPA
jgi:hypothetical protein